MDRGIGPSALDRITNRVGAAGAGAYTAVLSMLVLAASGAIGLLFGAPWMFPSLGATVMVMFGSPRHPTARLRNAGVGHAVGLVAGTLCLFLFGLNGKPSAAVAGLTPAYLGAAILSVAITAFVLGALRLPHPPAGATTLIVSLGIIATPVGILSMAAALAFTILVSWGINRLLGERNDGDQEDG